MAIAIPVFTNQLEKSREAADLANIRAAYATAMADYLDGTKTEFKATSEKMTQTTMGWKTIDWPDYLGTTAAEPTSGQVVEVVVTENATTGAVEVTCTAKNNSN